MARDSRAFPFVTIVMPAFNEAAFIEACLEGVCRQDYPADRLEILVADGLSTDGTRDRLARLARADPRIRVIDNPGRLQAAGLNAVIREARGEVIARMDVHCEYAPDYVRKCVEALERTGADNVGGAQRARARTTFQRALCAALESPLGVGGARYRSAEQEGFVDTVFLGAFRRRVFESVGLYDPKAFTNEDADLNQRILDSGGTIYLSREIVVHYFPRESFAALARQYYRYGMGRARTLLKHRRLVSPRPILPFLMIVTAALLLLMPGLRPVAPWAFGLYALVALAEAVRLGHGAGFAAIPVVALVFPVLHVSHGLGFTVGLVRFCIKPDWKAPEILSPLPQRDSPVLRSFQEAEDA